jgi:hypothetical protein
MAFSESREAVKLHAKFSQNGLGVFSKTRWGNTDVGLEGRKIPGTSNHTQGTAGRQRDVCQNFQTLDLLRMQELIVI